MNDNASQELKNIRRKLRAAESSVREKLDGIIRSPHYQKYLQEPVVTIRSGRYVVPVKVEFRANVSGLVHDTSSTGATVFIEPMSVVEANNDIHVLEGREQEEINRILASLSAEAGGFCDSICASYDSAVSLNVIFAKASLAYQMKASVPQINDSGIIDLKHARHPLIDPDRVVPIDVMLGEKFDVLVITGPNTGGKTVTLKTIGLLTLMTMCGLMIPADGESRISVFYDVMADIGDEQSIEQSLSTFSSHMTNIVDILGRSGIGSLVLIDELGAGTDPVEGAALAMSILESLHKRGARVAATTHYAELKAYAIDTARVENACCEFDVATLRPTYHLLIGVPGRSNAFAISQRIGLPEGVVDRARELVSEENRRFESVVDTLLTARQSAQADRDEADRLRDEVRRREAELEQREQAAALERQRIIEQARSEAKRMTDRVTVQANTLISELENIRKKMNAENASELAQRARRSMRSALAGIDDAHVADKLTDDNYKLPRPLAVGDSVTVADIGKSGEVIAVDGDQITVQVGAVKLKLPSAKLRLSDKKPQKSAPSGRRNVTSRATRALSTELDMRGMTVDEGIMELDRFIDSAVMSGISVITAIHGKGTGVLRTAVHEHLRRHKCVRSFRLGTFGEGETGVTVIELK